MMELLKQMQAVIPVANGETQTGREQEVNEATVCDLIYLLFSPIRSGSFQDLLVPASCAGSNTASSTCPGVDWRFL